MSEKNLGQLNLLEIGSNNFELIEFSLNRTLKTGETKVGLYGVNVAKVREVVRMPMINPLASRIPGVEGVFELRGVPIPAINLCYVLGDRETTVTQNQQIIVAEFSMKRAGFIVDQTKRIRRVQWGKVLAPSAGESSFMTGMILNESSEFLFILDLEKIMATIELAAEGRISDSLDPTEMNRMEKREERAAVGKNKAPPPPSNGPGILLVDDSSVVRQNVRKQLELSGFRVVVKENGSEALSYMEEYADASEPEFRIDVIVTDVEMPKMDGITLTKKLKDHPILRSIPVLLHSSLSNPATREQGVKVGASGYVIKSDPQILIKRIKTMLGAAA